MKKNIKLDEWESSYAHYDNFIFYPKEETVKFLNRFIRKRIGLDKFKDIISFDDEVRGLDFGCGIGRLTILLKEFGINSYGVDISSSAIKTARQLTDYYGYPELQKNFMVSQDIILPFEDNYFNLTISEGVLDSMHYDIAKLVIKEIERVTNTYFYVSLISGDDSEHHREFSEEIIVDTEHEKGTVQTFYNYSRVNDLLENTNFKIIWGRLIQEQSIMNGYKCSRYHLVLKKDMR